MKTHDDLLIEILTEELPPKALKSLAIAFHALLIERIEKAGLSFKSSKWFASPRRLAVLVNELSAKQQDQVIERKGPALNAAFDASGQPSKACVGFAASLGINPAELKTIKTEQGEWVGYEQHVAGKTVHELMPALLNDVIKALPIPKRMRWGDSETLFVRPVHGVLMLYGDEVINAEVLGLKTHRQTKGHRFHAPIWLEIPEASAYAGILAKKAYVIADFAGRRDLICQQAAICLKEKIGEEGRFLISSDAFLDEVTGLVEWPVALCGQFDDAFLALPKEVLISAMQDHQRYFPVVDKNENLLPYFITISNIESLDKARVIHGNERVLRARLADAAFFYETDQAITLAARVEKLKHIVFQAKLGTLYNKLERVAKLATYIAQKMKVDTSIAEEAARLSKADLTTQMVGEFPELQGVMGYYYALQQGVNEEIAFALKEQYHPRFSGDSLPSNALGQVIAIADRIDTLIGIFGINQIPTGDKDPYGLRRAALGVLRILIEKEIHLDLKQLFAFAFEHYGNTLINSEAPAQVLSFMQDRLRAWYLDQGVTADVFAAVAAIEIADPLDAHRRLLAVQAFKQLAAAEALSAANKRVSNILAKYTETLAISEVDQGQLESDSEKTLAQALEMKAEQVMRLYQAKDYQEVLLMLAELREPIDAFFDNVMVMTEDKAKRENRILMLQKLRNLFLQVADIALLQNSSPR